MTQYLVALSLCYILIKIPFWVLSSVRGRGHSVLASVIKSFLAYKTLGLIRGTGSKATPASGHRRAGSESDDPYSKSRSTSDGQYVLPLEGIKRGRASTPPHRKYAPKPQRRPKSAQRGTQLALPWDGEWPENKPKPRRDGQYQLPLNVQRQPHSTRAGDPPPPPAAPVRGRDRQLRLPADGQWPENKPKLQRDGQYRLPIDAPRVRRPAPTPPSPPSPQRPSAAARQLRLPADGQWPENRPRPGLDGQYELPLNVQRTRKPTTPPPDPPQPPPLPKRAPRSRQQPLPMDLPRARPPRPRTRRRGGDRK